MAKQDLNNPNTIDLIYEEEASLGKKKMYVWLMHKDDELKVSLGPWEGNWFI